MAYVGHKEVTVNGFHVVVKSQTILQHIQKKIAEPQGTDELFDYISEFLPPYGAVKPFHTEKYFNKLSWRLS